MSSDFMPKPIVEVRSLTKRFGDFTAVDNISFDIHEGEILGLLGPNGAGKTTTIHMLLGLITPTSGTIHMFGLDLAQHRETILQQVNFSSTYISMPFSLTVEENLKVIARLYGLKNIQKRIRDIIEKLEMGDIQYKIVVRANVSINIGQGPDDGTKSSFFRRTHGQFGSGYCE
jgi:ABC-2 type transport system ATP-binding protein